MGVILYWLLFLLPPLKELPLGLRGGKRCSTRNTASGVFFPSSSRSCNSSSAAPSKWYTRKSTASASDWDLMTGFVSSIQSSIRWSSLTPINFRSLRSLCTLTVTSPGEDPDPAPVDPLINPQLGFQCLHFLSDSFELLSSGYLWSLLVSVWTLREELVSHFWHQNVRRPRRST